MVAVRVLESLQATLDRLTFCFRILVDLLSDVTFQLLFFGKTRKRLPPLSSHLLLCSATELARKIRQREISSEQLVRLCIERIGEIQPHLNAVVDQRFNEAIEDAKKVDRILASLDKDAPMELIEQDTPFLGVPFSTKEGIRVQGLHQSYGLLARRNYIAPADADVVRSMREAGAIPLCVTNVSELGIWWNSTNCVYGTTNNPYDTTRTPGGSSGGEASLQAAAAIPISLGSDTGGSIRTPAAFCGLFGHKPTPGLTSIRGTDVVDPPPGYVSELQALGPMCRHADDLIPILKVIMGDKVFQLNLEEQVFLTKVNFFYLDDACVGSNLVSLTSPEARQALHRVISFLEDNFGVHIQRVGFQRMRQAWPMFISAMARDSYAPSFCQLLANNSDCESISVLGEWARFVTGRGRHILPSLLNASTERIGEARSRLRRVLSSAPHGGKKRGRKQTEADYLRREVMDVLGSNGVLLCPAHPTVAPYHGQSYTKHQNFLHAAIFNVLGFPATVVPLGLSQEGLPLSIQIVSSPFNDRLTLAVAKALERPFGGWTPPFREKSDLFY